MLASFVYATGADFELSTYNIIKNMKCRRMNFSRRHDDSYNKLALYKC